MRRALTSRAPVCVSTPSTARIPCEYSRRSWANSTGAAWTVRQTHVSLQHASALAAAATAAAEDHASRAAADLRELSGRVEALRDKLAAAEERVIRFVARAHAHARARKHARAYTHTRTAMRAHAPPISAHAHFGYVARC